MAHLSRDHANSGHDANSKWLIFPTTTFIWGNTSIWEGRVDKILIALSERIGEVSIIWFISVVGAPVGIASASFTLIFFFYPLE